MSNADVLPFSAASEQPRSTIVKTLLKNCEDIATAERGDTHVIASLLQKMMVTYYSDVRKQAMLSFWSALGAAGVGMLFFLYAIANSMLPDMSKSSLIGLVAGALAQLISAVNFYLYFKAARQFATFHICLERTNRFLLANTIAETLDGAAREDVRRALVETIASAPMLTLETVTGQT
jgi:hypothetical protein